MRHRLYIFLLFLPGSLCGAAQQVQPTWESINERGYPEWFKDAKLGIFVHWGLYSVPAFSGPDQYAEWFYRGLMLDEPIRVEEMRTIERNWGSLFGDQWSGRLTNSGSIKQRPSVADLCAMLPCLWHAEHWDPDQWSQLFAKSGAKYVLLVTKHHDGYCLWNSRYSPNWNSVVTGPHRDIVGELTDAVRRSGLKMGFYYSLPEWTNKLHVWMQDPDSLIGDYVSQHMIPQFKELILKYRPSVLFTDGEWQNTPEDFHATELIAWYYNTVGAEAIVNNRWGSRKEDVKHGYLTPEYQNAPADTVRPWAESRGIGHSFGVNHNEPLSNYLTSDSLIRHFVKLVAAGGGMTVNVGPEADGTIPMLQQERLLDLGAWLKVNGEAIYASRPCTRQCTADSTVFFTRKSGNAYAHCFQIPEKTVVMRGMPRPPAGMKVTLLGCDKKLNWTYLGGRLTIHLGNLSHAELTRLHSVWVFKMTGYGEKL